MKSKTNFDYSLEFIKVSDNLKNTLSIFSTTCAKIDFSVKYEFFLNENQQIILSIDIGIACENESNEYIANTTINTTYLIIHSKQLEEARFSEFIPLLNDTFNILKHSTQKQITELGLYELESPEFSEFENEFMYFKSEFLKIYFPSSQ